MASPFVSYAQNGEDVVLWRALHDVENGRYVDVGAADPIGYSATYAFYEAGWSGINLEPEPQFADALRRVRPRDVTLQMAAGDRSGILTLQSPEGTGLTTGDPSAARKLSEAGYSARSFEVPMQTLDQILADHFDPEQPIHLLKVDVEGLEKQVLKGIDLSLWRPWVIVVEATEPMSQARSHDQWESLVVSQAYSFTLFDGLNRYYVAAEHSDLTAQLDHGPCIFDGPVQRADTTFAIERHREALIEQLQTARDRVSGLETTAASLELEWQRVADDLREENASLVSELDRTTCEGGDLLSEVERLSEHVALKQRERALVDESNRQLEMTIRSVEERYAGVLGQRDHAVAQIQSFYDSETWRLGRLMWHGLSKTGLLWIARRPAAWVIERIFRRGQTSGNDARAGSQSTEASRARGRLEGVADPGERPVDSVLNDQSWAFPVTHQWDGPIADFAEWLTGGMVPPNHEILARLYDLDIDRDEALLEMQYSARERNALNDLRLAVLGRSQRSSGGDGLIIDARCLADPRFAERGIGRHARNVLKSLAEELGDRTGPIWVIGPPQIVSEPSLAGLEGVERLDPSTAYRDLPDASHFVSLSPNTDRTRPDWVTADGTAAAVIYDLIPYQHPHHYFTHPADFVGYAASLVWLRHFDRFWAISDAAANHAAGALSIPRERFSTTGVASPLGAVSQAQRRNGRGALSSHELRVALCGGGDARKNLLVPLQAIRFFVPVTSTEVIGVLSSPMSLSLIEQMADDPERTVDVLGPLSDSEVSDAYGRADLVVVPSFAEGYSLPVAEAVDAGKPVIASDIPAHRELLGLGDWLVDPADVQAWLTALRRFQVDGSAWHAVQRESLEASRAKQERPTLLFERSSRPHSILPRVRSGGRPSLAILTPLPDQATGIADYSDFTLAPLQKYFDISLVVNDLDTVRDDQFAPVRENTLTTSLTRSFDGVLHILGNSHFHIPAIEHFEQFGGAVLAHDNRMTDLYSHYLGDEGAAEMLSMNAATVSADEMMHLRIQPDDLPDLGYGSIGRRARPLFLHSESLAERVESEVGVAPIVLPFCPYRVPHDGEDRLPFEHGSTTIDIASFGEVNATFKRHDLMIEALAWLLDWGYDARLVCVGSATAGEADLAQRLAAESGVDGRVEITGRVHDSIYRSYLSSAHVAVQLRNSGLLTLSGAVVDAIAFGVPLVTTTSIAREVSGAPGMHPVSNSFTSFDIATRILDAVQASPPDDESRLNFLAERSPDRYCRRLADGLMEAWQ